MFPEFISWIAVGVVLLACSTMLISRDWRRSLGALGLQYLAMFVLVLHHLPFVMGAAKLIAGWMVVAILAMTRLSLSTAEESKDESRASQWFRVALMAIVAFVAAGAAVRIEAFIPGLGLPVVTGGLLLVGGGIIHLGITSDLLKTILGLLTMLAGFEIIYAAVESSIMVVGMLAIVNLSLGLAGSYLLVSGTITQETEAEL
jgi:hypothetical protein